MPWITCTASAVRVRGAYLTGTITDREGNEVNDSFTGHAIWSGTSFATATATSAIAATLTPGQSARDALATLLANGDKDIKPYPLPPTT